MKHWFARIESPLFFVLSVLVFTALSAVPSTVHAEAKLTFEHGSSEQFSLEYQAASASDFQKLFKSEALAAGAIQLADHGRVIRTELSCTLERVMLGQYQGKLLIAYRFGTVELGMLVNEQPAIEYVRDIENGLKKSAYVLMEKDGTLSGFIFPGKTPRSARSFIRVLVSQLHFQGDPETKDTWVEIESDSNGRYEAEYLVKDREKVNALNVIKRKRKYLPEPFDWRPSHGDPDKVVESDFEQMFDIDNGRVTRVDGQEKTTISMSGKLLAYVESTIRAVSTGHRILNRAELSELSRTAQTHITGQEPAPMWLNRVPEEDIAQMHAQQLKGRDMTQLMEQVQKANATPESQREQRTDLFMGLQAAIYLFPKTAMQLRPLMAKGGIHDMPFRIVVSALAGVGNSVSQGLLREAIQRRRGEPLIATHLVSNLSDVPNPEPESIAVVLDIAKTAKHPLFRHGAELGLGTMALMLRLNQSDRALPVVQYLIHTLRAQTTHKRKIDLLRALGNTGAPETNDVLGPYTKEKDNAMRAIAVSAYRWNPTGMADELLIQFMQSDQDPAVRQEAINAYTFRPITDKAKTALSIVALTDSEPALRLGAASIVYRIRHRQPDLASLFVIMANQDADEEVRTKVLNLVD